MSLIMWQTFSIYGLYIAHKTSLMPHTLVCFILETSVVDARVNHACIMILPEFISAIGIFPRPAVDSAGYDLFRPCVSEVPLSLTC